MKKLFTATFIMILSSCSSEPIKTTEISAPTLLTAPAKPLQVANKAPEFLSQFRYHTILSPSHEDSQQDTNRQEGLLPRFTRYLKTGLASWYGPGFHGRKTATGEIFDMHAMTAAHKTLPIPSYAQVTNLENHRSVIVRINDRGPYIGDRVIDLSYAAAKKLDMQDDGVGKVEIKAITSEQALPQLQEAAEHQEDNLYLQVGSFSSKKKALKLHDEIAAHHLPEPEIRRSSYKASTLYKVQIGPIDSTAKADKLSEQLASIGITDTQFVTETKQM
ncbi:MAG: septal ring lytic transglycosylase RlpA family protein [Methylococcaceae bacterium]